MVKHEVEKHPPLNVSVGRDHGKGVLSGACWEETHFIHLLMIGHLDRSSDLSTTVIVAEEEILHASYIFLCSVPPSQTAAWF